MELIEREPQLKKLNDAWSQVRAGKGSIALVTGEAGIGKTSLIEQFISGQRRSARVLWGACDDLFSPQPLGPFLDIALQLRSDLLHQIHTGADRLTISTHLFIDLQKNSTPTIVVLEDLHWADEATLDVVKFLGRRIQLTKTLLVLSYRDDEVSSKHPLYFLLGDFPAHLSTRIPVPHLSKEAVQILAQQAGKQSKDLYSVTGGNPFFVSEVIAAVVEGVPASVRDAVLSRVARLTPPAKEVVELVALIPGAAEIRLIEAILHPAASTLDECLERGILRSRGDSLAFRHELARQAVEDSLPVGKSRDLHTRVIVALAQRMADEPTSLARLVHHTTGAGDHQATLRYAPAAARQASALGAHREAAALYQTALAFAHFLSAEAQADLLESLSIEYYLIDRLAEAIQTRQQAGLIWERLGHNVRSGDCKRWLSRMHWGAGHKKEAEKYADLAIEILLKEPPGSELAMAFSNKSQLHMLAWEEAPALEWGQRAIELAEKLGAVEILVHAMTNVGSAESIQDMKSGHRKIEQALQIAREKEMHEHVARCYSNLASDCIRSRQYAEGQHWLEEGLEYTTDRDVDFYKGYLLGWQAQLFFDTGRWAEAQASALAALHLSRNVKATTQLPALIALGHLKVRQGDPTAQEILDRAQSLALMTGELQRIGPLACARAEAAWWQGETELAAAEAFPGYELALSRNDLWTFGQVAYWMWRAGKQNIPLERLPLPYALMVKGEWQPAAQTWERIGCPFETALALAEGDEPAKLQALAIFERLGARPAALHLRHQLQALGVKNIPPEAKSFAANDPSELTPREMEVLQLIAAGLSNPEIADRLTVSVGTVKAHTANIYSKLGVRNRVQALAKARDHRLL